MTIVDEMVYMITIKKTKNTRNKYFSPILKSYFKSINEIFTNEQINKSIDNFSIVVDDERLK